MIQGKVLSVSMDVEYPKKDGSGAYKAFILSYMNDRNEKRDIIKPMAGLKFKPTIAKTLRELAAGDAFYVQMEKNQGGYDDIVAIGKGEAGIEVAAKAAQGSASSNSNVAGSSAATRTYTGNTYETPEERKLKQRLIVRQAALNQAIAVLTANTKKETFSVDAVQETAQVFEDWVYRELA